MTLNSLWGNIKSEVEFLNKYPTLLQATSDNDAPIPGYLFGEINALTFINDGEYCIQLTEFLLSRAHSESEIVKFKALKTLLHLVKNGHISMLEAAKFHEVHIKEIDGTNKVSQDYNADFYYKENRNMTKELLSLAFSESFYSERLEEANTKNVGLSIGYGAQASTNKLQGFGNTPNVSKSMGDRVTEGLTNFVDKILSPSSEDKFYKQQASMLSESLPQYQPVIIKKDDNDDIFLRETPIKSLSEKVSPTKSESTYKSRTRVHIAGRAGGGWDDSDTETEQEEQEAVISLDEFPEISSSVDSNEIKTNLPVFLDYVDEHNIVEEFLIDSPLETIIYKDIDILCKRCLSLNCDKILEFLVEKLNCNEENIKLRSLIFMEYLLQQDIINIEPLIRIALPKLKQISEMGKNPLQAKSRKICLIVDYLNKSTSSPKTHLGQMCKA